MNTKTEATASSDKLDIFKWFIAILLIGGGLFSFYYFEEHSQLLRVLTLLAACTIAIVIASTTETGRYFLEFSKESHLEIRKVVWPTRQETMQMTGLVIFMVVMLSLVIWALDSTLFWLVRLLTSH
jgi:preprotein translocase subunit SecE